MSNFAEGYDAAARDDAAEFERLDARVVDLEVKLAQLTCEAGTLAVHVLGHFAMASASSPAVCQQWAEAVQKTIAEQSTH